MFMLLYVPGPHVVVLSALSISLVLYSCHLKVTGLPRQKNRFHWSPYAAIVRLPALTKPKGIRLMKPFGNRSLRFRQRHLSCLWCVGRLFGYLHTFCFSFLIVRQGSFCPILSLILCLSFSCTLSISLILLLLCSQARATNLVFFLQFRVFRCGGRRRLTCYFGLHRQQAWKIMRPCKVVVWSSTETHCC